MRCQSFFSWKDKKKKINLSSAKFALGVVMVNLPYDQTVFIQCIGWDRQI